MEMKLPLKLPSLNQKFSGFQLRLSNAKYAQGFGNFTCIANYSAAATAYNKLVKKNY